MKPGLAVLPLEVWADIFISPYQWINRQELGQIANKIGARNFAEKLQKLLHGCGKPTLHYLDFHELRKREIYNNYTSRASLIAAPHSFLAWGKTGSLLKRSNLSECKFPETEMPENIRGFKRLTFSYLDDQILDFLAKIKPLLTNVFIYCTGPMNTPVKNLCSFLDHLLPMLGSIHGIHCDIFFLELLEVEFPETLARAKELCLYVQPASIPTLLSWLSAPLDFGEHGPRFLKIDAGARTIFAIIDAIQEQFLAATSPATFVIFLQFNFGARLEADEFQMENAATNEQLVARLACFKHNWQMYGKERIRDIHYVEIMRHPIGANAIMREWVEQRAYYEKLFKHDDAQQIHIDRWLTIGRITKRKKARTVKRGKHELPNVSDEDEAGPSTSAKKMKK